MTIRPGNQLTLFLLVLAMVAIITPWVAHFFSTKHPLVHWIKRRRAWFFVAAGLIGVGAALAFQPPSIFL